MNDVVLPGIIRRYGEHCPVQSYVLTKKFQPMESAWRRIIGHHRKKPDVILSDSEGSRGLALLIE
jgi:hypothetical protein